MEQGEQELYNALSKLFQNPVIKKKKRSVLGEYGTTRARYEGLAHRALRPPAGALPSPRARDTPTRASKPDPRLLLWLEPRAGAQPPGNVTLYPRGMQRFQSHRGASHLIERQL